MTRGSHSHGNAEISSGSSETRTTRIRFEPGLEGLRGLLLPVVLCFHAEFAWATGGFLALPTFFTLSGYLITSLFLAEWERSRDIALLKFWARRFRRLMPAALLTLGAMSLFGIFIAMPDQLERLHADVLWSLFYLANWHFIISGASYIELFAAPSPVQHFWSLAVEEQFYFLYPLVALAVLRSSKGSRAAFGGLLGALILASVLGSILLRETGASIDRVYYGSDTRSAELFVGALLATMLHGRAISSVVLRRGIDVAGVLSLIAMLALWKFVKIEQEWLYRGGFAAYSLLSAAVIAAAVQPGGPVKAILSGRLLCWLGRISYGGYLFHWPIYLWLSADHTGLDPWPLLALRTAVTLALAEISYRFVESPIRSGRFLKGWQPFVATPVAFAIVAGSIASIEPEPLSADEEAIKLYVEDLQRRDESGALQSDHLPGLNEKTPRVAFFGDSTAMTLSLSLAYQLESTGRGVASQSVVELGCGLLRDGVFRVGQRQFERPEHCSDRDSSWSEAIAKGGPDIAVVLVGPWEVPDRKLPGETGWRHLGDPVLDDLLLKEMLESVDLLAAEGSLVVWLTSPQYESRNSLTGQTPNPPYPESDPDRMERLNELIFELPELRPGLIHVVDLAAHMKTLPGGPLDPEYRPDGTHWSLLGAQRIAHEWLVAELLRVYREQERRAQSERLTP